MAGIKNTEEKEKKRGQQSSEQDSNSSGLAEWHQGSAAKEAESRGYYPVKQEEQQSPLANWHQGTWGQESVSRYYNDQLRNYFASPQYKQQNLMGAMSNMYSAPSRMAKGLSGMMGQDWTNTSQQTGQYSTASKMSYQDAQKREAQKERDYNAAVHALKIYQGFADPKSSIYNNVNYTQADRDRMLRNAERNLAEAEAALEQAKQDTKDAYRNHYGYDEPTVGERAAGLGLGVLKKAGSMALSTSLGAHLANPQEAEETAARWNAEAGQHFDVATAGLGAAERERMVRMREKEAALTDAAKSPDYAKTVAAGKESYDNRGGQWLEKAGNVYGTAMDYMADFTDLALGPTFGGIMDTVGDFANTSEKQVQDTWTQEEQNNFYYLWNTEGKSAAIEYAEYVNEKHYAEQNQAEAQKVTEWALQNGDYTGEGLDKGALAFYMGMMNSGLNNRDFQQKLRERVLYGRVKGHEHISLADVTNIANEATMQKLNETASIPENVPFFGGKGLGDVYGLAQSIGKSAISAQVGDMGSLMYFGDVGNTTYSEAIRRGATQDQALLLGAAAGAVEILTEKYSVEGLLKNPKSVALAIGRQTFTEASEEFVSEVANWFTDDLIMGENSEFNIAVQAYMKNGLSYEEAVRKAWNDRFVNAAWAAIGGGLSGGVSYGGKVGLTSLQNYGGDVQNLFDYASQTQEGSAAQKYLDKFRQSYDKTGRLSQLQASRLQEYTMEALNKTDKPELVKSVSEQLKQSHPDWSEAKIAKRAEAIVESALQADLGMSNGESFRDRSEQQIHDQLRDQMNGRTLNNGNWLDTKALSRTKAETYATEQAKTRADESARSVETKNGEKGQVTRAVMTDDGLKLEVQTESGTKEYNQSDLKLTEGQQLSLSAMSQILGKDAAAAYNGMSYGQIDFGSPLNVIRYANAWASVRDKLAGKTEAEMLKSDLRNGLTDIQAIQAWKAGQNRTAAVEVREKARKGEGRIGLNGAVLPGGKDANGNDVKIKLQGVSNQDKVVESKKYKVLQALCKAMHIDCVLFDSSRSEGKGKDINGAYINGTIYLDWAVAKGNRFTSTWVMFRAMSHELTHFIQQQAPQEYAELKSFVTDYLSEKMGKDYNDLVTEKMWREYDDSTGYVLSRSAAEDEVVADACETMLRDSEYVQKMFEENRSLFDTISGWVHKFLRQIQASDIAAKELQPVIKEVRDLWDAGLRAAVEGTSAEEKTTAQVETKTETVAETATETVTEQEGEDAWAEFDRKLEAENAERQALMRVETGNDILEDFDLVSRRIDKIPDKALLDAAEEYDLLDGVEVGTDKKGKPKLDKSSRAEIERRLKEVLAEGKTPLQLDLNASKNAATTGGRVQFATKQNPRTVTTEKVEGLVQNCLYGLYDKDKYIPVRSGTPQFFIDKVREDSNGEVEIAELPWAMVVWHVQQEVEDQDDRDMADEATPHAFLPGEFAEVIEKAEKPNKIILQNNGNYAMTVRHRSKAGKDIAVVISVGPENGGRYLHAQYMEEDYDGGFYNIAVTTYPIESFDQYYKKYIAENENGQSGRIIYDKDASTEVGSGSTVPSRISDLASSKPIVSDESTKSNTPGQLSVRSNAKTDRELLRDFYERIVAQEQAKAKHNEDLLKKAHEQTYNMKQQAIERLHAEQKKALEDFRKAVDRYETKEREVTQALREMDKLVQAGDNPAAIQQARAKVNAKEAQLASAVDNLTKSMNASEIQKILQQERQIERQRTRDRIRESANRRDLRSKIDRLWRDLNRRITSPTEKKHIPAEVMQQAIEVLEALNMDTSRDGSMAGERLRSKLLELKQRYEALKNDKDYSMAARYDEFVSEMLGNMIEKVGDTPIDKMSVEQMESVYETLKALDHVIKTKTKIQLGERMAEIREVGQKMIDETRSIDKAKKGWLQAYLNTQLSPERMFNRLGGYHKNSVWNQLYRMLDSGQLKQTQLEMEGSLIFDDLINSKEHAKDYKDFVDPSRTVDVGLKDRSGNAVKLTHGMMVSLWMHLQNEQNRRHVAYGGLTIPGLKDYYGGKKAAAAESGVRVGGVLQQIDEINRQIDEEDDPNKILELEERRDTISEDFTQEMLDAIEKNLTDYDRQWIAACREMFDGFSKRVLNETTMQVYGIKRANVENYFPLSVDKHYLQANFDTIVRDFNLENAGFMKERVESRKPVHLYDVSDVAAQQVRRVSQYAGLMPAIRAFNQVLGYTSQSMDSVQSAIFDKFGNSGMDYIENLMADLNGARGQKETGLGAFLNRLRGHMAQSALTLSLRTAMAQAASYPTAASVVGWKALHKALWHGGRNGWLLSKADKDLIQKWSPLLYYRMKGYSSVALGDIAGMNDRWSRVWKKARWLTGWIQAMDGATVGRLWYAAEFYVQDKDKDLKKGTDAYYEEVAKVFNDIVEKTQPNYTTMQRPDILRNPNALVKQLTMFMTQRLQNFNIMVDAAATYSTMKADFKAGRNGVTAEDVRQAGIQSRRAFVSQAVAAMTIVAFKALADIIQHSLHAYRDDDDDELKAESIGLELLDMFIDTLAGNVLGGGEAWDIAERLIPVFNKNYYGIEVSGIGAVNDFTDSLINLYSKAVKDDGKPEWKDYDKVIKNLCTLAGIPWSNGEKFVKAGWYWIQDAKNGELFRFEAGVDRTMAQQATRLYRAYTETDGAKVKKVLSEVPEDKQKDLYAAVRKVIKTRQKNGEITVYESMRQMQKYGNASEQTMQNYIKDLYENGLLPKNDAIKYLQEYGGRSAESAEKTIREMSAEIDTGVAYSDLSEQYMMGEISAEQAVKMLQDYGGKDAATAKTQVEYWDFQKQHPTSGLDFSEYKTYANKFKPIGLTPEQYEDYATRMKTCKGVDANGDGKTDSGSKKAEVVALIDSMDLTPAQKDQMFLANNYAASGLPDAPWNK